MLHNTRWSRDGQSVAYTTLPEASLWRARADGSDAVQLTFPLLQAYGIAWSPDGQEIAFHALMPGKPGKICMIAAQGGMPQILLANEACGEDVPNWSPDGKAMMFARARLDKSGNTMSTSICLYDLKTSKLTKLPGSEDMGPPSWPPDGRYVAAQSGDFSKLMLFDFHTRKWIQIASGTFINSPSWTRGGKALVFQNLTAGSGWPVYRYVVSSGRTEEVASRKNLMRAGVASYLLLGLTPENDPVAAVVLEDSDIYALELTLP